MSEMSIASHTKKIANYQNFSIEKPTQSMNKALLIQQSEQGLKIFIKDNGEIHQVGKDLIEGLPKRNSIPQEFFNECYVGISKTNHGSKVSFHGSMRGGAITDLYGGPGGGYSEVDFSGRTLQSITIYTGPFELNHYLEYPNILNYNFTTIVRGIRIIYENNSQDVVGTQTDTGHSYDLSQIPGGAQIVGVFGGQGARLDRLGFRIRNNNGQIMTLNPIGGPGGAQFNCSLPNNNVATGLRFRSGADLDAIGIIY